MNGKIYFTKKTLVLSIMLMLVSSIFVFPSGANGGGTYDYVIITTKDIVENSQELDFFIRIKEIEGHSVLVVTEDDFGTKTGQYPNDRADKIRKWLVDNYVGYGIEYVLLIGDPDPDDTKILGDYVGDIPMKMCWPRYFRVGTGAPTDLYFSDLDSNWDLDGDGFYHEMKAYNTPTSPDLSIDEDTFSVKWTGYVKCDYEEDYTFRILSDDGVQLAIDNNLVIDLWNKDHLSYDEWTGSMSAGLHQIFLLFREDTKDAICNLYWRTEVDESDPHYIKTEIIPSTNLYYTNTDAGGLNAWYYHDDNLDDLALTRIDSVVNFEWATGDISATEPDYNGEVIVGRIPVYNDNYNDLDKILRKIINYETDPGDISWRESILLPMVPMNDVTTSASLGEAIKTYVADPAGFYSYRIYAQDYNPPTPDLYPCEINTVKNEWINGYGMVTWHTHGGEEGASHVMDTANLGILVDSKPAFTMQASCHNAYPENPDNLAYSLLRHGAIATIAGTRMTTFQYGEYTTFSPVEYMNHQIAYYYSRYVINYNMPAGKAYNQVVKFHSEPNANAIEFNLYGDPDCYLLVTNANEFPTADANGPYTGYEGSQVTFDASGSVDPEAMPMEYRWDFDGDDIWDTAWSTSPYAYHTWGDDYSGTVKLEVRDEIGKTDTTSTTVTINNVAPTATFDDLGQPNPQFILPYQELTFLGGFTDPGWEDTHTATWDFGDTTVIVGDVSEENIEPDSTGTVTGDHSYSAPGTYIVTLTVTDDDGDSDTATTTIIVVTALEALQDLDDYLQNTPDDDFKDKASTRKKAFSNKFNAIYKILEDEDYQKLIDKLIKDVRIKADGLIDGDPTDDWIIDYDRQYHICMKVDDINTYLETFI
ncbi:MAG: hypothetical protein JSV67_00640 [Thermoplasmatales archaeon]|nr:MAG: hypothetical protein JSV67_00640 [Thermoplasmatales archaeon]